MALQKIKQFTNPWVALPLLLAAVISVPLLVVTGSIAAPAGDNWSHILSNLVPAYVKNTLLLMGGVAVITFVIGVPAAWLVTTTRFFGRRVLEWALILPIAIPGYIAGFAYTGMLDYTSPLYSFFRNHFDIHTGQYFLVNLMNLPGAVFIFSITLYPYVYLIARAYFRQQSASLIEASASLGMSKFRTFTGVIVPVARPAIAAGISLALMEVLNDYGLVKYYGVDTFTTGIFTAWFAFGSLNAALRLAVYLLTFVLALIFIERFQRRKIKYVSDKNERPMARFDLTGKKASFAFIVCALPVVFGFVLPFSKLVHWTWQIYTDMIASDFINLLLNSFLLAAVSALLVAAISVFLAAALRYYPLFSIQMSQRLATLGYAIPGAVVAVGLLVTFLWLEEKTGIGITLTGTWFALVFAYIVRFMAVGYNSIESGFQNIPLSLDHSSRSLGRSKFKTLAAINMPLLTGPVIAAALLVFIDVLKELPLTLILRPFNFDTLAIRAFEYASDERVAEAAPAAIIIIFTGLLPVILLNKLLNRNSQ